MKIVGVGAGPHLLTGDAISAIENAKIIFGSKRAIELAKNHIRCDANVITDYSLDSLPENAVVLSTGDPMLSGLGKFAKDGDEIIPGISSMQLACAKLGIGIDNLAVITAHSGEINSTKKRLIAELALGKNVFLLPGTDFGVEKIADFLKSESISRNISICERLGYQDERISTGTVENPPHNKTGMYCVMISNPL